jgi:hypothetical protein
MIKLILLSLTIFFFTACTSNLRNLYSNDSTIDFASFTNKLTKNICEKIEDNSVVFISDFVNETNFQNKSQLGFLLSNELKVNILNKRCTNDISIQELQLAKHIKVGNNGTRILTRQSDELKSSVISDESQALVGTYIITEKQIIIFLKLINLSTSQTISSSSASRKITREIQSLEGIPKPVEPTRYRPFVL